MYLEVMSLSNTLEGKTLQKLGSAYLRVWRKLYNDSRVRPEPITYLLGELGKFSNYREPQIPHLYSGPNAYIVGFLGWFSEEIWHKVSAQAVTGVSHCIVSPSQAHM